MLAVSAKGFPIEEVEGIYSQKFANPNYNQHKIYIRGRLKNGEEDELEIEVKGKPSKKAATSKQAPKSTAAVAGIVSGAKEAKYVLKIADKVFLICNVDEVKDTSWIRKVRERQSKDERQFEIFKPGNILAVLLILTALPSGKSKSAFLSRLLSKKFWRKDLWVFSKYPHKFELEDKVRIVLSIAIVFGTLAVQHSLFVSLLAALAWNAIPAWRNWASDKLSHYGLKFKKWFKKKGYFHPQKLTRALIQNAWGIPIFIPILTFVFWWVTPFTGWSWVLLTTVIMTNTVQVYDSYWRMKQYGPEKHQGIRRLEYVRSFILNFATGCIVQFSPFSILYLNPWAFIFVRRIISEAGHFILDIFLSYKSHSLTDELKIYSPRNDLKIYLPDGETREIDLEEYFKNWKDKWMKRFNSKAMAPV